jgi:prepilin peptidase CpaA
MVNQFSTAVGAQAAVTIGVLVLIGWAAREDLIKNRIPNAITAAGAVAGVVLAYIAAGKSGLTDALGGALVGLAIFLPFYLLRGMGAGDVKLMAAAGAFVGTGGAFWAAALALIAGGTLALAIIARRLFARQRAWQASATTDASRSLKLATQVSIARKERCPYAVPIGVGVLGALWMDGSVTQLYAMLGLL